MAMSLLSLPGLTWIHVLTGVADIDRVVDQAEDSCNIRGSVARTSDAMLGIHMIGRHMISK